MASITIRNLEDSVKQQLRVQAANHGRSMEEEARRIIQTSLARHRPKERNIVAAFHERFAALGGVDLELPPRNEDYEPPDFS